MVWTWTPAILWATRWRSTETTSTGTNPSSRPSTGSSSTQTPWLDTVRVIYTGVIGISWCTLGYGTVCTIHRLNMELDLQSLFGLHVQSCTHCLAETPPPPPPPPRIWAHIRGRYRSAEIDDMSLWVVTPWYYCCRFVVSKYWRFNKSIFNQCKMQEISQVIKFILGAQPVLMYFDYFLLNELSKKSDETLPAVLLQYT